ncbi:MAG: peptidylprolyl isomerase [Alistipes onderdonkii]|nr:peptidylprolyl isomerase [Alistipes onderdonkii]
MLKKGMLGAAFALLVAGAFAQKQQVMLDKVVAVVGSSSILHSEVAEYARQLTAQRRAEGYTSDRDPMNEALEALMTQKLLFNQAQIDSVKINAGDIATHVEQQIQNMIETEGSIPKLEAKHHMAIFSIRENMRQRYEEQSYASSMQSEVVSKVSVIPGEVERFYKSIDKDSLPTVAEQYVYAQITRFPKSITEAKQRTRERLLDMRERIITGKAKFENLARMYSQDPGTMMRGGEMDPTELNGLEAPFADALENMKPGQISEVVETQYGFHLIQLIDKKGNLYHCRHILIRPTYTTEELSEPDRQLDSIAELIRADSLTFEEAALRFSDDPYSRQNGGIVTNHELLEHYNANDARYTATKFLKEDFGNMGPSAIADFRTLSQLKVGDISPAYQTQDMNGNQLSKIVKLVQIIPTHVASLNEDYLRLEQMALNRKQEKVFGEWLSKKIDGMYVYIDPEFRDGEFANKHWVK